MPLDLERLLQMAPGIAAGAMGNPGGGGAFMQGLEEGRQIRLREQMLQQQQGRQSELDASALETQRVQRENIGADNRRAEEAAKQQKLMQALAVFDRFGAGVAETATDPVAAENQMLGRAAGIETMFGIPQGQLSSAIPNMGPIVSNKKKVKARELYEHAEKLYGPEALANDSITIQSGELFGDVKPSQLRAMFAPAAVTQAGAPAAPMVPDPESKTGGSFDAQFADVLAGEETKLGRKLTREERAKLRLREKASYDAAGRAPKEPKGAPGSGGLDDPFLKTIMENPGILDTITPSARAKYLPLLAKMGFEDFGRPMSDGAVGKISESKSAVASLKDLRDVLQKNEQYIGPISGLQALSPWSPARQAQADIDRVKQRVGKALEGGVLRKEDEVKYKKILATLTDVPETAIYKVDQLIQDIERDIQIFEQEQKKSGRRVTATMPTDGGVIVATPDGQSFTFPTPEAAAAFKKEAGIK